MLGARSPFTIVTAVLRLLTRGVFTAFPYFLLRVYYVYCVLMFAFSTFEILFTDVYYVLQLFQNVSES